MIAAIAALMMMAGAAEAQIAAGQSRADLAVYAGGAWTTPWLAAGGQEFGIGFNPIFGGFTHVWFTPHVGARLHLAYMRSGLPEPGEPIVAIGDERIHNWLYDLALAVRPFARADRGRVLSSFYLFAGGGGFTPNVEGGAAGECVPPYHLGDACLPYDWREATVGQGTVGAGLMFLPITRQLGLFAEGGLHVYSSPFRMGEAWTGRPPCTNEACLAEERGGRTTRLVGGLMLALGPPPPPPFIAPPPPPPPAAPPEEHSIMICVLVDGFPQYVEVVTRPTVGDTLYVTGQGVRRPLRAAFPAPPPTASGRDWFEREEAVFLNGREYVRFGVPRVVAREEVARIGEYRGVPLFAGATDRADGLPTVLFLPVQDGCIFQPYQLRERVRVRG
jgi:hypothetical protein